MTDEEILGKCTTPEKAYAALSEFSDEEFDRLYVLLEKIKGKDFMWSFDGIMESNLPGINDAAYYDERVFPSIADQQYYGRF